MTRRCPLTCVHCYNNLPMADREARGRELDYEEHCRILDELADAGCLWLLYTGGEIFARRDFLDIYTYAKKKGFLITLFTNGTLITERIADYLAGGGRSRSRSRSTAGRGDLRAADRHSRLVRQVHARHPMLLERGLPLALKTVAVTINKHEIPACSDSPRTSSASNSSSTR